MLTRTGTGFTWNRRRYEAGERFDLGLVPVWQQGTMIRLYGLTPWRPKKKDTD